MQPRHFSGFDLLLEPSGLLAHAVLLLRHRVGKLRVRRLHPGKDLLPARPFLPVRLVVAEHERGVNSDENRDQLAGPSA